MFKDLDPKLLRFLGDSADAVNHKYGGQYNWGSFPIQDFTNNHLLAVCYRGAEPVGFLAATLNTAFFDARKVVLRQQLLFSQYPKASYRLLCYLIDFGKLHANHIITCIGQETNIKPASLERLGFTELETSYRMEV